MLFLEKNWTEDLLLGIWYFYLWRSRAGLGLLCDVLVVVVMLVKFFCYCQDNLQIFFIKIKLYILRRKDPVSNLSLVTKFCQKLPKTIYRFFTISLFDFSYFSRFSFFCIHIHAAGLWTESVLVGIRTCHMWAGGNAAGMFGAKFTNAEEKIFFWCKAQINRQLVQKVSYILILWEILC